MIKAGLISNASFLALSILNGNTETRSVLLMTRQSEVVKALGYFLGLSSPSGVESRTQRMFSPRSKLAGQTRFPTFSMNRNPGQPGFQAEAFLSFWLPDDRHRW